MRTHRLIGAPVLVLMFMVGVAVAAQGQDRYGVENWPWGAEVDESMFGPDGDGVVLHVDASATDGGDGSREKPFRNLERALDEAKSLRRALQTRNKDVVTLTLPQWLRLQRRDATVTAFTAEDAGGKPGPWREVAAEVVRTTDVDYLGLHVSNDDGDAKEPSAEASFTDVSLNGKPIMKDAWRLESIGGATGEVLESADGRVKLSGMADDGVGADRDRSRARP